MKTELQIGTVENEVVSGADFIDMLEEQEYREMNSCNDSPSYLWCHDQERGERQGFFKN